MLLFPVSLVIIIIIIIIIIIVIIIIIIIIIEIAKKNIVFKNCRSTDKNGIKNESINIK